MLIKSYDFNTQYSRSFTAEMLTFLFTTVVTWTRSPSKAWTWVTTPRQCAALVFPTRPLRGFSKESQTCFSLCFSARGDHDNKTPMRSKLLDVGNFPNPSKRRQKSLLSIKMKFFTSLHSLLLSLRVHQPMWRFWFVRWTQPVLEYNTFIPLLQN